MRIAVTQRGPERQSAALNESGDGHHSHASLHGIDERTCEFKSRSMQKKAPVVKPGPVWRIMCHEESHTSPTTKYHKGGPVSLGISSIAKPWYNAVVLIGRMEVTMSEKVVSSPADEQVELNLSDGKITETPPAKTEAPQVPAVVDVTAAIIDLAKDPSVDMDKLEKLIAMRDADEARTAKKLYFENWTKMQGEFDAVRRSKDVKNRDGEYMYSFAPLEDIVEVYGPVIADHGFSYRFSEEPLESGEKRVWMYITGYGHEESNYTDIPVQEPTKVTNAIQQRGSTKSYGRRYTFIDGFSVVLKGEDDDGASFDISESLEYAKHIAAMRAAQTGEDMIKAYRVAYKELANDQSGQMKITMVKEQLKREFMAIKKEIEDASRDD